MKQPWAKFFFSDWQADQPLRACCLAARGLWFEMLGIMHTAEPRGNLTINGTQINVDQLALMVGAKPREVATLVEELDRKGVFSRDMDGTIYSRRMRRDTKKTNDARAWGLEGGNPILKGSLKGTINANHNGGFNGGDKPNSARRIATQKPESNFPKLKPLAREARAELEAAARRNAAEPVTLSSELAAMLPKVRP